jgi:hypothetical protein
LQYKRKKLKSGATTFVFKQMYYGEWLVAQWFEMEFTSQSSPYELRKKIERTLDILEWSWDFKTLLILSVIFGIGFNYYSSLLEDYYSVSIAGGFEPSVIKAGLEETFRVAEQHTNNSHLKPIFNLSSSFVDLAIVFDLF